MRHHELIGYGIFLRFVEKWFKNGKCDRRKKIHFFLLLLV